MSSPFPPPSPPLHRFPIYLPRFFLSPLPRFLLPAASSSPSLFAVTPSLAGFPLRSFLPPPSLSPPRSHSSVSLISLTRSLKNHFLWGDQYLQTINLETYPVSKWFRIYFSAGLGDAPLRQKQELSEDGCVSSNKRPRFSNNWRQCVPNWTLSRWFHWHISNHVPEVFPEETS